MKKLYCFICDKYRKFENPKTSYLFEKTLVLSIICSKCKNKYGKLFKEEESIEILRILVLIKNIKPLWKYDWRKHKPRIYTENVSETRNYLIEEINRNELISKKPNEVCTALNYIEHFLTLAFTITGCVPIFAFASLVCIATEITNSVSGLQTSAITAGIKKYKSKIKKNNKKRGKIVLLAKSKLNRIEVLIFKTIIDSVISHDEFVLINNVLKNIMKWKKKWKN